MSNQSDIIEKGLRDFDNRYREATRIDRIRIKDSMLIQSARLLEEALNEARSGNLLSAQVKRVLSEQTLNLARQP
jgi:hypothetical protein